MGSCSGSTAFKKSTFNLPEDATFEVNELFRVSEPIDGAFFTSIRKIHLLSDGNLIVQNYPDHQLYEFNRDGEFVNVIGRRGRGPGEFMETYLSYASKNDSLHVFDFNHARHQVFWKNSTGDWKYCRERIFRSRVHTGFREQIPEDQLIAGADGEMFGIFRVHPRARDTLNAQYVYVSTVDMNIEHSGETSRLRLANDLALRRGENNSLTVINNARFYRIFYHYLPEIDEVIYLSNTSNEIMSIDANDNERVMGYLPYDRFPTSRNDVQNSLKNLTHYFSGMDNYVHDKILVHEPYYHNITLHENRLWVQLARSDESKPNWVVTSLNGDVLYAFHGPQKLQGLTIHGNRFYGSISGADGASYFAGFELVERTLYSSNE